MMGIYLVCTKDIYCSYENCIAKLRSWERIPTTFKKLFLLVSIKQVDLDDNVLELFWCVFQSYKSSTKWMSPFPVKEDQRNPNV